MKLRLSKGYIPESRYLKGECDEIDTDYFKIRQRQGKSRKWEDQRFIVTESIVSRNITKIRFYTKYFEYSFLPHNIHEY